MDWTQIVEKFGVTTAVAFVSILLGSKLVSMVLTHYFKREEIHDETVKKFTEVIFEITSVVRELKNSSEDQNRAIERWSEESSSEHNAILKQLSKRTAQ